MSVITNNLLLGDEGYFLTKSLRFRSSASAYLNKTIGTGGANTKHATSFWMKRGNLTTAAYTSIYSAAIDANNYIYIYLTTGDRIGIYCQLSAATYVQLVSTLVLRDPSAWYHVFMAIDTTQATAANRFKLWLNGSEITSWFINTNNSTQNTGIPFGANCPHNIGRDNSTGSNYFDGYLAEFHDIWQPTTVPTVNDFGETSVTTGVWIPKKYTGTYGAHGFYLPFTDVATTSGSNAGLGKDFSGNSNYFNTNNISVTSGSTYDSMKDVPTLTDADTANYCTLNPLDHDQAGLSVTLSNGNLTASGSSYGVSVYRCTFQVPQSGKWYWESVYTAITSTVIVGIRSYSTGSTDVQYRSDGQKVVGGTTSAYGASWTTNDVIGIAVDRDAGTITFYKNNSSQGVINIPTNSAAFDIAFNTASPYGSTTANINFGQRPFAYTPPTGFVALNTFNLPTPTIGATASSQANDYFDASLYTGNSGTQSITNSGSMQPDFVWLKSRSNALDHGLFDSVRGVQNVLASNGTGAANYGGTGELTAFNSNGFTLVNSGSYQTNQSGYTYVAWQWKANGSGSTNTAGSITSTVSANTTAGFSIVTYTSPNLTADQTVGHGLGVEPSFIIVKNRTGFNWDIYHKSLGYNSSLTFTTSATRSGAFGSTINSTVFTTKDNYTHYSTNPYVAYCFAQVAGYSAFGSYTGNGSTDGTFVYLGFRPAFVLTKRTDSTGNWYLWDNKRIISANGDAGLLYPDSSLAESDYNAAGIDLLSNGFKIRNSDASDNGSGGTFIYMAFAENPFKYANAR